MPIRVYKRPIPAADIKPIEVGQPIPLFDTEEIFVLLEEPLLELTRDDVMWLKSVFIDALMG